MERENRTNGNQEKGKKEKALTEVQCEVKGDAKSVP
jgi:hypothetical protein